MVAAIKFISGHFLRPVYQEQFGIEEKLFYGKRKKSKQRQ